jgi:hypothetical protein
MHSPEVLDHVVPIPTHHSSPKSTLSCRQESGAFSHASEIVTLSFCAPAAGLRGGGGGNNNLAFELWMIKPHLDPSSSKAAHTGDWRRVPADPSTQSARLARVILTFIRRMSSTNPTPLALGFARTQLRMITSICRPW